MYWGYSPALDFLTDLSENERLRHETELNIIIIGAADARHILKTLSKYYTHKNNGKKIKLNFYVHEVLVELITRELFLLLIAFEPLQELGLKEKARMFMEIYGNTIIRPKTATYIYKKSFQLIHCVTDLNYLKYRLPFINLSSLKYKERDQMEIIYKFWQASDPFNISCIWDRRLRQDLGVRYDTRNGVYDWDYHMRLKDYPYGLRINSREYSKWRDSGIAFAWLETEVSEPNRTLGSVIAKVGDKLFHHGYLGDMYNAPYINYGLDCEDKEMTETRNGIYGKRATDIMERNLLRLLWEIEHNEPYLHPKEEQTPNLGVVITELTEQPTDVKEKLDVHEEIQSSDDNVLHRLNMQEKYTSITLLSDATITFLPATPLKDLTSKEKFKKYFHIAWIAQNLNKQFTPDIASLLADNGLLIIENKLYQVTRGKDDLTKYEEYLNEIFNSSSNCSYFKKFNCKTDFNATFIVNKN